MSNTNDDSNKKQKNVNKEESKEFVEHVPGEYNRNTVRTLITEEGIMCLVTHVYDDGVPYVRTLSIDPSTRLLHSNVTAIDYLNRINSTTHTNAAGDTADDAISISSDSTTTIDLTDPQSPYLETWRNQTDD